MVRESGSLKRVYFWAFWLFKVIIAPFFLDTLGEQMVNLRIRS
jgi:hypothetical protein